MTDNPGARTLGTAVAKIQIQLAGVAAARARLQEAAKSMRDSLKDVGKGGDEAGKAGAAGMRKIGDAAKGSQRDVMSLGEALNNVRTAALGVSAAAALITFKGVGAAKDLKQVEMELIAITGSAEGAKQVFAELEAFSKKTGQPLGPLQQNAASMVRLSKQLNVTLSETLMQTQKLAALDPSAGIEGAVVALRELASGDTLSLNERFEIGRNVTNPMRDLVKSGDTEAALKLLNDYQAEMGITEESMITMSQSSAGAFARMTDAITRASATAFGPLFERLAEIAEKFAELINKVNEANPQFLQVAAVFIAATAAIGPLIIALGALATAYTSLKTASAGLNLAGPLKYAAVGATAVAAGAGIGQQIAQAGADAGIIDPRLKSDSKENFWDVIGETVKKLALVLYDRVLDIAGVFAKAAVQIKLVLFKLSDVFTIGISLVSEMFGNLKLALGHVIEGFGKFIDSVAGFATHEGIKLIGVGKTQQVEGGNQVIAAQEARAAALSSLEEIMPDATQIEALWQDEKAALWNAAKDFLFPATDATKEALADTAAALKETAAQIAKVTFETDQLDAFIGWQEDIVDMEKDHAADRLSATEDHESRKADIEARFNEQREKALTDQMRNEEKDRIALARQIGKMRTEAEADAARAIVEEAEKSNAARAKAQEDAEKLAKDHGQKIADIERQAKEDILKASSKLDAIGIWNAQRAQEQAIEEENNAYTERKQELQAQLAEELAQIQQARIQQVQEQAAALDQQIAEQRASMAERHALQREDLAYQMQQAQEQRVIDLQKEQEAHTLRLAQLDKQAAEERQRREMAFIEEFNRLATSEQQKLAVQKTGQDQSLKLLEAYWAQHNAMMARNAARSTTTSYTQTPTTGNPIQGPTQNPGTTPVVRRPTIGSRGVSYFHTGGRAYNTGAHVLQKDEEVLSAQVAQQLRRFMNGNISGSGLVEAFGRGGNGAPNVTNNIERISNHYGEMGNRSNREMSEVTVEAVQQALLLALGKG